MDARTATQLNKLSQAFYAQRAQEFSDTRRAGWPGWERCWQAITAADTGTHARAATNADVPADASAQAVINADATAHASPRAATDADIPADGTMLEILDLASGNLRFETWAITQPDAPAMHFTCIDSCTKLLPDEIPDRVSFTERDIIGDLLTCTAGFSSPLDGATAHTPTPPDGTATGASSLPNSVLAGEVGDCFSSRPADIAVCFGFAHHVPGAAARVRLIEALLASLRPGGLAAISFWRFADDAKMRAKAERTTQLALELHPDLALDNDDYLLGFNDSVDTFRYCHSFSTEEIDALLAAASIPHRLLDRWQSDGRNDALNEYVMLARR